MSERYEQYCPSVKVYDIRGLCNVGVHPSHSPTRSSLLRSGRFLTSPTRDSARVPPRRGEGSGPKSSVLGVGL